MILHRHRAPLLLFAAVAMAFTWPALSHPGEVVPGAPTSDTYDHLWGYWWYLRTLSEGTLPLRTTVSHWPDGGLLWFIDPSGALLSLPFQVAFGTAFGYTIAVTLQVFLGMIGGYAAAFTLTRDRPASALAGVIYGASPYVLSLLYSGTMEFLALAPLPLVWVVGRRALVTGSRGPTLLAGALCAAATLGNFYYAAFAALLGGIAIWGERRRGWLIIGERAASIALVWAVLAAPIIVIAAWTLTSSDAVVNAASAPGWAYQTLPATDLYTFLHPGAYYFPDNREGGNGGIIHVNYVGWIALVAALVGAFRARLIRAPLAITAVLALGPTLCVARHLVGIGPWHIPLPAALLYLPGSPFRLIHHPFRLVVLALLFMGIAAAFATRRRPRLAMVLTGAVLFETLRLSPAVFPIPTAPATAPQLYADVHEDDTVRGIWDFPPNYHVANRRYEALQIVHGKVIPYGVNAFLPDAFKDNHFVRAMMQCLQRPALSTIAREGGRPLVAWLQRPVSAKEAAGRTALHTAGYDLVVLHLDALAGSEATCARGLLSASDSELRTGDLRTGTSRRSAAAERTEKDLEAWRIRAPETAN